MATIDTDEKFRLAASQHLSANSITGATVLATDRKIISAQNVDITPSQVVLEAALDAGLVVATEDSARDSARNAIPAGRLYLQRQLAAVSPDTLATIISVIKPVVDNNTILARMVGNQIDQMSLAFTWTAASVKTPTTQADRARYIAAVEMVIALLG